MLTTERLLTHPAGFGLSTATPAQRAACRIIEGRPLRNLAADANVQRLVGGAEAVARLPSQPPLEVVFLAAVRSAKTMIAAARAIVATQTVDVTRLGPGEVARVSIVSLRLDNSAVAHRFVLQTMLESRLLRPLVVAHTASSVTVQHSSGRHVEIATVAGAPAGGSLVSRWSAGCIFDEAPRMNGADDRVVNLDHTRSAVLGRLLPGAQALYIGSPWAPHGPVYEMTQEHWAQPTRNVVVMRGTGPMLNPYLWTPEHCALLEQQDPVAYQTDVRGEFADPEAGLLSPQAVQAATRSYPLELPPVTGGQYYAALDPSEGSATGNAWTLVILGRLPNCRQMRVALAREWRGADPDTILGEIASTCQSYGLHQAHTDQYAAAANAALARNHHLNLIVDKATGPSKLEDYTNLATAFATGAIEIPPDSQLRRDLLSVRKRVTQSGMTIVLPKTGDGRHCDYAPALCLAVKHAGGVAGTCIAPVQLPRAPVYPGGQKWDRDDDEWDDDPDDEVLWRSG